MPDPCDRPTDVQTGATAVTLLQAVRQLDPTRFAWRDPPYEYETVKLPIDILSGSATLREQIAADTPAAEIASMWEANVAAFCETRSTFLMY